MTNSLLAKSDLVAGSSRCADAAAQMAKHVPHVLSRAAVAGLALLAASLPSYADPIQDPHEEGKVAMTMKSDLLNRSPEIHWPQGFDPTTADLFSHNELLIKARCERVWRHIVEAPKWPEWYPNSKNVRIVGDGETVLKEGTTFRWTTFGLPLESRINEFVPYTRIGWYGYAPGAAPNFYHTWYLTPEGTSVLSSPTKSARGGTLRICATPTRA
jgi:hypothetical protein